MLVFTSTVYIPASSACAYSPGSRPRDSSPALMMSMLFRIPGVCCAAPPSPACSASWRGGRAPDRGLDVGVVDLLHLDGGRRVDTVRDEVCLVAEIEGLPVGAEELVDADGLFDADFFGADGGAVVAEAGIRRPGDGKGESAACGGGC